MIKKFLQKLLCCVRQTHDILEDVEETLEEVVDEITTLGGEVLEIQSELQPFVEL
jgi:hypothetical protein